jgi:hypothetical protein
MLKIDRFALGVCLLIAGFSIGQAIPESLWIIAVNVSLSFAGGWFISSALLRKES